MVLQRIPVRGDGGGRRVIASVSFSLLSTEFYLYGHFPDMYVFYSLLHVVNKIQRT